MKKTVLSFAIILILLFFSIPAYAVKDVPINVMVNGKEIAFEGARPFIKNSRILVPVRFVSEALGANVEWKEESKEVIITQGSKIVKLLIEQDYAFVGNEKIQLDVSTTIYNNRTYVPLRFVSQSLGCTVEWKDKERVVIITTKK